MVNYVYYNLSASCRATKFIRGHISAKGGPVYILTSPAKPRKDRAISPAVINEIGVPCRTLGILAWTVCSRIPAMSINATVNPVEAPIAKEEHRK